MRGRTLKNCFAILDEAQNATETQNKNVSDRIGEIQLVVNGDPSQVDLINKKDSGRKNQNILKDLEEIKIIGLIIMM